MTDTHWTRTEDGAGVAEDYWYDSTCPDGTHTSRCWFFGTPSAANSARVSQDISALLSDFDYANSFSFYYLAAQGGAVPSGYFEVVLVDSSYPSANSLHYWFNYGQSAPASTAHDYYIEITGATGGWTLFQRNLATDWYAAGFQNVILVEVYQETTCALVTGTDFQTDLYGLASVPVGGQGIRDHIVSLDKYREPYNVNNVRQKRNKERRDQLEGWSEWTGKTMSA